MFHYIPPAFLFISQYILYIIGLSAGLYLIFANCFELTNLNNYILTSLIVFSILISIYLHQRHDKRVSILKTTIASFIITIPAQYIYAINLQEAMAVSDHIKIISLIAILITVFFFALWFIAASIECTMDHTSPVPLTFGVDSMFVLIGYLAVNQVKVFSVLGVQL